jgi:hypothetical protein
MCGGRYRGGEAEVRTAVEEGSGEERGELKAAPSSGEWVSWVESCAESVEGPEPAILRFFVEAVVKFGALEPDELQGQAERRPWGRNA